MVHTSAASLYRALLDTAAQSPDDDFAHLLEDFRPADEGQPADYVQIKLARGNDGTKHAWTVVASDDLQATAVPMVYVQGPQRPRDYPQARVMFTSRMPDGARSNFTVKRIAPRLLEWAERVRKNWNLYGAGPKPAELLRKPVARRAVEYKPALLRAWADMIDEGAKAEALELGATMGALYYPGSGTRPIALAGPQQVAGLPDGMVSAYRAHDRRFVVMHTASGRTIGESHASRKAAETEAQGIAARQIAENGPDALTRAIAYAGAVCQQDARDAWAKAHGVDVAPAEPMPEPAAEPAADVPESADAWADRMVAMCAAPAAAADVAPALPPAACPAPAAPACPAAAAGPSAPVAPIGGISTNLDDSHPLYVSARKLAELRAELADESRAPGHRSDGFLQHIIDARQKDHDKLASAFAAFAATGDGTELAYTDGRRFCFLLPDASQPGKYRWQGFDASGFFTHSTHDTAADAVADAALQGYTVAAPGALDRLASLPQWARGMAVNEAMQEHNSGRMTWPDACDRMKAIHAEHDALAAAAAADAADAAAAPAAAPAVPSDTVAPFQMPSGSCSTNPEPVAEHFARVGAKDFWRGDAMRNEADMREHWSAAQWAEYCRGYDDAAGDSPRPSAGSAPVQAPIGTVSTSPDLDAPAHETSPRGDIHHSAPAQSSCDWPSAAQEAKLQFPRRPYRGPSDRHLTAAFLQYRFKSARRACQDSASASLDGRHGHGRAAFATLRSVRAERRKPAASACPWREPMTRVSVLDRPKAASLQESILSSVPANGTLILTTVSKTRNSQHPVRPVMLPAMRHAHGPPRAERAL